MGDRKRYRMLIQVAVDVDAFSASEAGLLGAFALGVQEGMFQAGSRQQKPLRKTIPLKSAATGEDAVVNATYSWVEPVMVHEVEDDRP